MSKVVAIITARGGSKRIPRKNIRSFCGSPILNYSVEAALESSIFDKVMVSTDDPEIAEVARQAGAEVPFLRSASTSNDYATTAEVLTEVLMAFEQKGDTFQYACCIYPTAPFVTSEKLKTAFELLKRKKAASVIPVTKFSFPIWRSFKLEDERLSFNWPENALKRSQDLPPAYHDAGQFYFLSVPEFLKAKQLVTDNTFGLEIPETEVQDIDTEVDWKLAEIKYELLFKK
jgi:pseudaminic acid cytidylyltransferase